MLPGATIQIDAPLGYKLPVRYGSDGTLAGEAGDLVSYLGSATDTGKWWVKGDQVCHKWSKWLDAKLQCMRLRKEGRILHWVNQDGDKGTATLSVMAAAKPAAPTPPAHVAAAAPIPVAPRLIATVPAGPVAEDAPVPLPATAKPLPQATTAALTVARAAAPVPSPAARPAQQPEQTAAGVRNMASPPLTASEAEQRGSASFVVANVRENDVLNVRSGPSSDYDVVASLRPGSRGVSITGECQSDWCPVRHQNATGWVNSVYLADETTGVTQAALRVASREAQPTAIPAKMPITAFRETADAPRSCLTSAARALLQTIEAKFGPVKLVSTCRAGATIAGTGRPSRHASGNAVDFNAGARKGEILRWLIANHKAGGTMTYPDMDHIHVDVGPHFVSIAGGQNTASWRGSRGGGRTSAQDDDD